ncbi:hypothetical protein LEAN103870_08990 [Legionella anisa]|uniref:Uncharacterized protein n=1 Tax=Legionella anisa TaxID=28082 RepID=A0AAX0WXK9_9GAMM|nr:hypothetical protein [Legionella anisa]AWN72853.1 hypothetical protein DLD14_02795 [Legionella anisa]KTC70699.1 hypothetical protein Lani_2246 [Legionella anisa]MBN5934668.1 hypothetical protein [Legionella anisa]MCW8423657.1 hypothetical protein [Legionella anisa]MCW8447177.1 hypothetical protein [Legionella anisa]
MWSKVKTLGGLNISPFGAVLLSQTKVSLPVRIFAGAKTLDLTGCDHIPLKKGKVSYTEMLDSLPKGTDMVHRGMAGHDEPINIATEGVVGGGSYAKRPFNLDLPLFIHKPKSSVLLSTSPDPFTVKEYMIGFQLIKAKGGIISMNLPYVFVRPQTSRHIDEEQFQYYQNCLEAARDKSDFTRVEDIFNLADGNNETTAIFGSKKGEDWRPRIRDLHSIVLVNDAAGRILSGFMKADRVEATTIGNPDFHKKVMSIEVFTTATGEGAFFQKHLDRMTKRAHKLGLIDDGNRILTLADVSKLMNSPEYQEALRKYRTHGQTMILSSAPKDTPIASDDLIKYALFLIKSNPENELVTSPSELHM